MNNSSKENRGIMYCRFCGEKLVYRSQTVTSYIKEQMSVVENVYKCPNCGRKATFRKVKQDKRKKK